MVEIGVWLLALTAIALIALYTLRYDFSPPLPTPFWVWPGLRDLLPEHIEGGIYDLGSGFGGLARALARHRPETPVVAVEISPLPWAVARLHQWVRPLPNLTLVRDDLFAVPLAEAGLLVLYLAPPTMQRLGTTLRARLTPGTVIVSHTFALPGWTPAARIRLPDAYGTPVYRYRL